MNREKFKNFVAKTLEEIVQLAERECGKKLSRKIAFRWFHEKETITKDIAEYITQKVFINENEIFPCVDIGVSDILDDGTLIVMANIAGYEPSSFQKNWQGEDSPFIHIIGHDFLNKMGVSKSDN